MKPLLILLFNCCLCQLATDHILPAFDMNTVKASFDAFEGGHYFFTDYETEDPLTLKVANTNLIQQFRFENAEHIGELFEMQIEKRDREWYIMSIKKI